MFVRKIWRYPVNSRVGELMKLSQLSRLRIEGDRAVEVRGARGRRTRGKLAQNCYVVNGGIIWRGNCRGRPPSE